MNLVNLIIKFLVMVTFSLFLASCSGLDLDSEGDNNQISQTEDISPDTEFKKIAWAHIKDKGWDKYAQEDWEKAVVNEVVADNNFHLYDETFSNKKVLGVKFQDKPNLTLGVPEILIDPKTSKVIGFLPTE